MHMRIVSVYLKESIDLMKLIESTFICQNHNKSINNMVIAKFQLVIENKKADMKEVQESFNNTKAFLKEAQRSSLLQLDEAKAMGEK
jgi:hypothetical protein